MSNLSRRDFLKASLAGAGMAAVPSTLMSGCVSIQKRKHSFSVDQLLTNGARVMWVAAHPDDESLIGSIVAKSSLAYKNPLYFLVLTKGDGGECCLPNGCEPSLADIRETEMQKVARLYKAELQQESYFNAPLPVESFPKRHEIAKMWADQKDPTVVIAKAIREFRPDIILTFAPDNGFTGHPEHQLASRFTMAGIRMAEDSKIRIGGLQSHKVNHTYFAINKYWPFVLIGMADPGQVTEIWDANQLCINGWKCKDIMARFSNAHKTQDRDMSSVRGAVKWLFDKVYLQNVNPYKTIYDPFETV